MNFKKVNIRDIIAGSWLNSDFVKKNFFYFLFLLALGLIYISNRYKAESLIIESYYLREDIKKLRSEYTYYTEKLMKISTELQIEKLAKEKNIGIEISKTPPIIINKIKNNE